MKSLLTPYDFHASSWFSLFALLCIHILLHCIHKNEFHIHWCAPLFSFAASRSHFYNSQLHKNYTRALFLIFSSSSTLHCCTLCCLHCAPVFVLVLPFFFIYMCVCSQKWFVYCSIFLLCPCSIFYALPYIRYFHCNTFI